jgi:hypothetical protein
VNRDHPLFVPIIAALMAAFIIVLLMFTPRQCPETFDGVTASSVVVEIKP